LAAVLLGSAQADPASVADLLVSILETSRRSYATVVQPRATLEIAAAVERVEDFLAQSRRFIDDRPSDIGSSVTKASQVVIAIDLENVVEKEGDVFDGSPVHCHLVSSTVSSLAKLCTIICGWIFIPHRRSQSDRPISSLLNPHVNVYQH